MLNVISRSVHMGHPNATDETVTFPHKPLTTAQTTPRPIPNPNACR